jgi:hypothetical protein
LPELRLTLSPFTRDYDVCWRGQCRALHALVAGSRSIGGAVGNDTGDVEVVAVRPCARN